MRIRLLLLLFLATLTNLFAQKSAPVAGDAAQLIDFLKKDYYTINPDNLYEEIMRDRRRVITIFKSYLEDTKKQSVNGNKDILIDVDSLNEKGLVVKNKKKEPFKVKKSYKDLLNEFNKAKNNLKTIKNQSVNINGNTLEKFKNKISEIESNITKAKNNLIAISYKKDVVEFDLLLKAYSDNKFIAEMIKLYKAKYEALNKSSIDGYADSDYQSSIQKSLPFLGGDLAFETLIDGLSRFLATRIKEELTTYVIEHIQEKLNNPSPESYLNELMVLMPRTTDYLKSFEADQVLNFIDESKQYIEDDLNNLLDNSANLRYTPRFIRLFAQYPELEFAFEALELIPQLSKVKNPIDYFDIIESSKTIAKWSNEEISTSKGKIATGIKLACMLAHSLTILDNGELKFSTIDFISNYGSESNFYKLYIGFLHQQNIKYYKDLKFSIPTTTTDDEKKYIFELVMAQTSIYEAKIKNILPLIITPAERLHNDALAIKRTKDNDEKVAVDDIHSFIDGIITLSESIVDSAQEILDLAKKEDHISNSVKIKEPTDNYFKLARISNDIFLNIHDKKYSLAIIKGLEIYSVLNDGQNRSVPAIVMDAKNVLQTHEILQNTIALTSINKFPTEQKEILELKNIALTMEVQLEKLKWKDATINNHNLYVQIINLINSVKNDDTSKNYITNLTNLKNALAANPTDFMDKFMSIDVKNLEFLKPVKEFINENIEENSNKIFERIADKTKTLINAYLSTAINHTTLDFTHLTDVQKKDYNEALIDLKSTIQILAPEIIQKSFNITDSKTIKLIHFLNDIALSESAEDIEKAISAFALPAGSFALKKKDGPFVSINSFPGILIGSEQRSFSDSEFTIGFTAPVGLYTKLPFKGNRWGLFAPIIDIAAPVRFRFDDNDNTETLPEFEFKNILSPGLYLTHRIGKGPFTLNFGGQWGPELQVISGDDTETFSDSFRVGVGVTLDIPLLTLYHKPQLD